MNFDQPDKYAQLKAADPNRYVLKFLSQRRSALVRAMVAPGPNAEQLELILRLAARVPDHRKLFPWRFLLFEGEARAEFGEYLATFFQQTCPDMPSDRVEHERTRFLRAPLVIGVVSGPKKMPVRHTRLGAGTFRRSRLHEYVTGGAGIRLCGAMAHRMVCL